MGFKQHVIECITDTPVSIRVKRLLDGLCYDAERNLFVADNPAPYIPLQLKEDGLGVATFALDPSQFTDGDYAVYYLDENGVFDGSGFTVYRGDTTTQNVPTPTELALRIANVQVGKGSLRDALNDIQTKVNVIYDWVQKQPK
jgi:hypothetical protein